MTPDCELLRQYAERGDQAAFADLVRRHTDLVYSIAVRVAGDPQLAEDATQVVFTKLARQARALLGYPTLVGWLHTTTRYSAINLIRGEERRRTREQEAAAMHHDSSLPDTNWKEIRPLLDEAVGRLGEQDRQAVLLRYFNGLSHQEVGATLGLSENSANKRVERALEKLRGYFASRGVKASSALLAASITVNSVQAAPVGLAEKVTPASLAGVGTTGAASAFLLALIMNTKTKATLAIAVVIVCVALWWFGRPTTDTLKKAALETTSVKKITASSVSQVETPKPSPATSKSETATSLSEPADPQADLKTAIADMARLLRTGDQAALMKAYDEPDKLNLEQVRQMQDLQDQVQQTTPWQVAPRMQSLRETSAQSYEEMETQTPTFNATGDEATYQLILPTLVNGEYVLGDKRTPYTFIKINGKWYMKLEYFNGPPSPPPPSLLPTNRGGN